MRFSLQAVEKAESLEEVLRKKKALHDQAVLERIAGEVCG